MFRLSLGGICLILGAALTLPGSSVAYAQAVQANVTVCKDGTTTAEKGRGACSHHGGVDASATKTARDNRGTSNAARTAACADGTTTETRGRGACSGHGGLASRTSNRSTTSN